MSNLNAELVLTANAKGLKKEIKGSIKDLKAFGKGGVETSKDLSKIEKASKKTGKSLKKLGGNSKKLGKGFKALSRNKLSSEFKKSANATNKLSGAFKKGARQSGLFANKQLAIGRSVGRTSTKIRLQADAINKLAISQRKLRDVNGRFIGGGIKPNVAGVVGKNLPSNGKGLAANAKRTNGQKVKGAIAGGKGLIAGIAAFTGIAAVARTFDAAIGSLRELDIGKGTLKSLDMKDTSFVIKEGMKLQGEYAGIYAADFVKAAYNIKSGIETLTDKGVADVTKAAAITAKATLGDTANMTSLFATAHGMFKNQQFSEQSDGEWANMFASVIATAVKKNKTDGAKMQQAIESAGDGALKLGMGMEEFIAILGILQKTKQAGVAGTNLKGYSSNVAKAEKKLNEDKKKPKVRLLDDSGKMLPIAEAIKNLKGRFGKELDGHEMQELKEAIGSEEAVSFITAFWDSANEINDQIVDYKKAGKGGLKVADDMAKSHDVDNTDSAIKIKEQSRDLALLTAAQLNKKELIAEYKTVSGLYSKLTDKMRDTGKALSDPDTLLEFGKISVRDTTGMTTAIFNKIFESQEKIIAVVKSAAKKSVETKGGWLNNLNVITARAKERRRIARGEPKPVNTKNSKPVAEISNMVQPKLDMDKLNFAIAELKKLGVSPQGVVGGQIKRAYAKGGLKEGDFKTLVDSFKALLTDSGVASELRHLTSLGYNETLTKEQIDQRRASGNVAVASAGISTQHPDAKAAINAYSNGKIGLFDFEGLVTSLSTAIPIERLEALFGALPKAETAQSLPVETNNITNIDNDFDQSQDKRQNIRNYHQKNIINVNVKSGSTNSHVGAVVGKAIPQISVSEPMGDKD